MGQWSQRSNGFGERLDILFTVMPTRNETRGTLTPIVEIEAPGTERCSIRCRQANEYFIGLNRMEQPFGSGIGDDLRSGVGCLGIVEPQILF